MAGRPPKPTSLKLVKGNPGKRPINKQEPDPTYLENLEPPACLSDGGKAVWLEIAPKLRDAKLLTVLDVQMLEVTCEAIAQHRKAVRKLNGEEITRRPPDEDGTEKGDQVNPWLIVQSMAFKRLFVGLREFGMTPAARTRIAVQPQGDLFDGNKKAAGYLT